ncbi:unnamed protein product [Spodoptera littoralis]|uniref:Glucose-methanol-choline oxidoreductase N-terminal domain-containing protein n=1 Tax=Spodoptera littoralis TaxID=7109 RepID=A0A9P0N5L8_SPOLI|nr:unnamed protein product [Spodoptera littoralis]CAH1645769.1 unnamed protein product [Spodoptera littoralis]
MLSASTQISRVRQLQQAFSVLALLNINCNTYPEDATVSSGDMFDYVVVGGGTAGLVVTTRLVEANYSVLVIEAGDIPGVESLVHNGSLTKEANMLLLDDLGKQIKQIKEAGSEDIISDQITYHDIHQYIVLYLFMATVAIAAAIYGLLKSSNNTQMMVTILLNINSKSRGSVSLRSTDPKDEPIIEYGFYDNEDDLNEMIANLQHYTRIENTPYFQGFGLEFMEPTPDCRKHEFGSRMYWRCYALCMIALTGRTASTCAMGSVVDTKLRVNGVNKLRVIGSSVMPNTLGGSIFAPEVALAEKAAEMIVNDRLNTIIMSSGVTSMQIDQIINIQGAFRTLALLNMVGYLFREDAPVSDDDIYDYIVVGGGTAGCVVAGRLVEANFKTLVIEAGNNPGEENYAPGLLTYIKNSRMDWNFTTPSDGFTDQCHKGSGIFFGKVLGGTGNTDYMLYGRGNPQDYRSFNEDSWNWKNMLKYFKKSERLEDNDILNSRYRRYHGTKGRIGVIKENRPETQEYLQAYKEAGKNVVEDVIGAGIIGYSGALYHIAKGSRTETATAYLSPLKDNPNLYLTRNSTAVKIIFDENKRAVGVQFVKDGKSITVRAMKEVIVTTGAVKTPQLLMLSGIGPKQRSYGEVTLRNTDPFAMPNIFPNSYTNDNDLNDIVDYIIDYYKLIETPKFQSMGLKFVEATGKCGRFQFGSRQFWRCYALCMIVPPGRFDCVTMNTTAQLAQIANVQSAFSVLAMLNMYGYMYPEDAKVSDGDTYDCIVIGGGTAGCVVAARLAEANFKTLIIEAGHNPSIDNSLPGLVTYLINSHSTWNFTTLDDGFTEKCHEQAGVYDRGYVLGGSGAVDYMIYSRGNPRDYEKFSVASDDPSWNWSNMQKYFKKSEKLYDTRVLESRYGQYHGTEADNKQMLLTVLLNVIPKSQGVVKLRSTDPFDQPQIYKGYYSNDEDLDVVVEYIKDYARIEGFSKFQSMGLEFLKATDKCDQFEFGSTEYWRCYALCMVASTVFHCGTCAMGTVVDNQLNVMGVHRLRVVDASVIPNPVSGSIFAPLVAVAERASDLIIKSIQ